MRPPLLLLRELELLHLLKHHLLLLLQLPKHRLGIGTHAHRVGEPPASPEANAADARVSSSAPRRRRLKTLAPPPPLRRRAP